MLRLLLENGADKDKTNPNGLTLIRLAALNGHLEVVRLLLDLGAEKDKASKAGATPLHLAALNGHAEVVRLLLQARIAIFNLLIFFMVGAIWVQCV